MDQGDGSEGTGEADGDEQEGAEPPALGLKGSNLGGGPGVNGLEETSEGGHDSLLALVVFVGVEEGACGLAVAVADRGECLVFKGDEAVRFTLGLGKELEFGGGEVCFLHEGIKGHGGTRVSGAFSVGSHEVPVHDVVVVGTGGGAVADVENVLEVPAVSLVARHGVGSGHAGEVVGGLAEHVGEAVRVLAAFDGMGYPAVHAGAHQEEGEGDEYEHEGTGEGDEAGGACVLHHVNLRSSWGRRVVIIRRHIVWAREARATPFVFRIVGKGCRQVHDGRTGARGRSHRPAPYLIRGFVSRVSRHSHTEQHTSRRA